MFVTIPNEVFTGKKIEKIAPKIGTFWKKVKGFFFNWIFVCKWWPLVTYYYSIGRRQLVESYFSI